MSLKLETSGKELTGETVRANEAVAVAPASSVTIRVMSAVPFWLALGVTLTRAITAGTIHEDVHVGDEGRV